MATAVTQRLYELQVKVAADSLNELKKLQQVAEKTQKSVGVLESGLKGVVEGLAAGFTVDAFISAISSAISSVDELGAAAERLGISTEVFSALSYAAEQTDVSAGELDISLKELQKTIGKMGTEDKGAKIFESLGIETAGKDVQQVLQQFAEAFKTIKDPITQTNALIEVFGRSGLAMRPLLNQGAEGIAALTAEAEKLGLVIGGDTADRMSDLDNLMKTMSVTTNALFVQIADGLAPALTRMGETLVDASTKSDSFKRVGEALGVVLTGLANAAAIVAKGFEIAGGNIGAVMAAVAQAAQGNISGAMDILSMRVQDVGDEFVALGDTLTKLSVEQPKLAATTNETAAAAQNQADTTAQVNTILNTNTEETNKNTAAKKEHQKVVEQMLPGEKEWQAEIAKAAHIIESNRTPLEVYNQRIEEANVLKSEGLLIGEQYQRQVWAAAEAYGVAETATRQGSDALTQQEKILETLGDKVDGYGKSVSGMLVDFATGADDAAASFSDMAASILRDIAQMVVQMMVMEPLIATLKSSVSAYMAAEDGAVVSKGSKVNAYAKGGVVHGPTVFPMANGTGLMGEAGPEAIMPLKRLADGKLGVAADGTGGGAGVVVNVYNESGADVTTETNSGPNGEQVINIMVQKAVEKAIGQGRFDSTFQTTYGLQRRGQ